VEDASEDSSSGYLELSDDYKIRFEDESLLNEYNIDLFARSPILIDSIKEAFKNKKARIESETKIIYLY
jgi:hypothetical protein